MTKKRSSRFSVLGAVGAMLVLFAVYADGPVAADNSKQSSDQDPSCGDVFAINAQNELLLLNVKPNRFRGGEDDDPGNDGVKVKSRTQILGLSLTLGDVLVGIDFRPAGLGGVNQLYGLGRGAAAPNSLQLYYIDTETGGATPVSAPTRFLLVGTTFGFDFNPVTDLIRVTSDSLGRNAQLNPTTGSMFPPNTPLQYAPGDPNSGKPSTVTAVAHTNPDTVPHTSTVLYDIDTARQGDAPGGGDVLAIQVTPNSGQLHTVGRLLTDTGKFVGFDIGPGNGALAVLEVPGELFSRLVSIDLLSGRSLDHGRIRGEQGRPDELVTGLAIELGPACETPGDEEDD